MKRYQNLLLLLAVVMLVAVPLWMVQKPAPGPDGKEVEIFRGADDQAKDVIGKIAGFIGYYLGAANTRVKYDKASRKAAKC